MEIKETKKTGAEVVKIEAIHTNKKNGQNTNPKPEEPKTDDLTQLKKELQDLKTENDILKKSKFADLNRAKLLFDEKAQILKKINLFATKKLSLDDYLNQCKNLDDFGDAEIKISIGSGGYKDVSFSNNLIVKSVLDSTLKAVNNKIAELETELLTINM